MLDEVCDIAVLFAENLPKEEYSKKKLDELNHQMIIIDSAIQEFVHIIRKIEQNEVPKDSPQEFVHIIRKIEQNEVGGLIKNLALTKRCTSNINM